MLGPYSNVSPRHRLIADAQKSAGLALRASLLKASPQGEGFHSSQRETLSAEDLVAAIRRDPAEPFVRLRARVCTK